MNSPSPTILQAASFASLPWLRHAFSSRQGGVTTAFGRRDDLNLGFTADDPAAARENRRRFLHATAPSWPLATARQIHSSTVLSLTSPTETPQEADALVTATPSLLLGILTADCVPLLLVDCRRRVVAAVHAGWRGTAASIAEQTVQVMSEQFSSRQEDLLAAIGPSIGPCCYQVGDEFHDHFSSEFFDEDRLDLWEANRHQLLAAGVRGDRIETLAQCTACARTPTGERIFFSHRSEHGSTGRMMAVIGIA